jgi:pimeloyl-ACP methyl ester carboxylesterase
MNWTAKIIGLGFNLMSLVAPRYTTQTAIRLFGTPPKPRIRPKEQAFLDTAHQQLVQRGPRKVMEYHWGNPAAPAVVMSYGWGYNAGRWRHFVPELVQAGYRVIAYDPSGHGHSPAGTLDLPTNAAIIRAIIIEAGGVEVIIAHSFGGGSTVIAMEELPWQYQPKRMVVMATFSSAVALFRDYANTLGLRRSLTQRMRTHFEQKVIHRSLNDFDVPRIAARLAHIEALLVHSPNDPVTPFEHGVRYHSFWPGSHLLAPESGGHHLGTPATTQAILDFAIRGQVPAEAETQERPINTNHDLARFFSGIV